MPPFQLPARINTARSYRHLLVQHQARAIRRQPRKSGSTRKGPAGRDSLMMPDEFRQFRAKCQELGNYELDLFAVFATTTALRKGSLLPRKWADVHNLDGDLPFIMVPLTKNGEPRLHCSPTKRWNSEKSSRATVRRTISSRPNRIPDSKVTSNDRTHGTRQTVSPSLPAHRHSERNDRGGGAPYPRLAPLLSIGTIGPGSPDNVIAAHGPKSKELERYNISSLNFVSRQCS